MKKLLLPFIYFVFLVVQPDQALTQDLGRHLTLGKIIVSCLCVPSTNMFSYAEGLHPFVNHHYLSEVIFYLLASSFGLLSLLILKLILLIICLGLLVATTGSRKISWWAAVMGCLYLFVFSERFDTRPELLSFVILSLMLFIIGRVRKKADKRLLYILPLLEVLWVNTHIYFPVGIVVYSLFLVDEVLKRKLTTSLIVIGCGMLVAPLLNPYGVALAIFPFTVFSSYGYSVVENQNIFFLNQVLFNSHIVIFEFLVGVLIVVMMLTRKHIDFYTTGLITLGIVGSVLALRNFPLFIIMTYPVMVRLFDLCEEDFTQKQVRSFIATIKGIVLVGTFLFVVFHIGFLITNNRVKFGYIDNGKGAVDFFKRNNLKGPIFNDFDIGSYLIYRLYPFEKVFVDGRPEAYSVSFFDEYKKIQEDKNEFEKKAKQYNFNVIIFSYTDITPWAQVFLIAIADNPRWKIVYLSDGYVVLVKDTKENKHVIDAYYKPGVGFRTQ